MKNKSKKAFISFELAFSVAIIAIFSVLVVVGAKKVLNKTISSTNSYQQSTIPYGKEIAANKIKEVEIISPYVTFDGVDDRFQTSIDSFRGIDPFTIVFLVKPTYTGNSMQLAAKPHGGSCTTGIALAVNNTGTASMSLDNFSGKPYCSPYRGLGGWTGKASTNLINWDEVNLIAFKGYYHQFTIYINGLEETSNERDNGHPNAGNTVWNIGSSWSIGSSLFQGEMYKFAVFNQRISKDQLDNMRDLESWEGQNNLIHYIDFKKYFPPDSVLDDGGGLTVTSYGRDVTQTATQ